MLLPEYLWESLPQACQDVLNACVSVSTCEPCRSGRGPCLAHECPGLCMPQLSTPHGRLLPVEVGGSVHGCWTSQWRPLEAAVWGVLAPCVFKKQLERLRAQEEFHLCRTPRTPAEGALDLEKGPVLGELGPRGGRDPPACRGWRLSGWVVRKVCPVPTGGRGAHADCVQQLYGPRVSRAMPGARKYSLCSTASLRAHHFQGTGLLSPFGKLSPTLLLR